MRGGMGASWHAIEKPMPVVPGGDKQFGGIVSHGGSGWGGNPPAENEKAWQDIYRHADWLGFDWCRVEFEQRMYEPERNRFDWDNPEMRILYRILDWCQRRKCDVFLTQMWANVGWNAFPEFRDSVTGRIHSGPASVEDFAEGLATMVEHLVKTKKYTCIRWLCITNEPSYGFSWFQRPPNTPMSITPALAAVRKALDEHGLGVQLSGPDVGTTAFDPAKVDYQPSVGAYDLHDYYHGFDWKESGDRGQLKNHAAMMKAWAQWAHQQNKPLFLSEYGSFMGYPGFPTAMRDAEMVVRDLSAGVDGFNRWSLLNRGDLDGPWQLVQTWDITNKKLLESYMPFPNAYYFVGLLSRYTAKHSAVLSCSVRGGMIEPHPRVFAAALRSPSGNLTFAVVNDAPRAWDVAVDVRGFGAGVRLYKYCVSQAEKDRTDLVIDPKAEFMMTTAKPTLQDRLAPESLTIYTTYQLKHSEPGITADAAHPD
jgi:hypothetical protein